MTERRSEVRAALRTFVAVAAVILLVHGIAPHGGHFGGLPVAQAGPVVPTAASPPDPAPPQAPEDIDHDGCPKPGGHPCSAGWAKPPQPPSRHGRPARALGRSARPARPYGAGVSALRWTRASGPRLPIFRC
ncbi:hypothetical protein AB0B89_04045 [Sphaerisporangium sp. NPDC049002]|uniref:hypothetical protein n=1 Tax=unclassified Sphaerisporangium TaxID=2630420 RepID=UPI0033DB90DD